jgi:integrase
MQRAKGARLYIEQREGRPDVWIIRDGSTRIRTGLLASETELAEQKLAEYIAEKYGPEAYKAEANRISIPEVLSHYVAVREKEVVRRRSTGAKTAPPAYHYHIPNLITFWHDKTVADVKKSVCEKYEAHRLAMTPRRGMRKGATAVSYSTIRQELKTLSHAISEWHKEAPLAALPVVWTPPAAPPRMRYLERSEVAAMLRAARRLRFNHLVRYILIGVYTGTRDDAMRRLRWIRASHDGYVDTVRGILYRSGFAEAQTNKKRTPMIIPDRLLSHMRRWARIDARSDLTHVITYMKPLPTLRSTIRRAERINTPERHPQPVADIHKAWSAMVKAAGLGPDVTPHTLKHTAITWMIWSGMSMSDVSEATGTSMKTIEEVYWHHRPIESLLRRAGR